MNLNNLLQWNASLFSGIDIEKVNQNFDPEENIPPMDGDLLVSNIMLEYGLCTPVYSEADVMKTMITTWWDSNAWNFAQMWRTLHLNYNPIENYNRFTDNKRKIDTRYDATNKNTLGGSDNSQLSGNDTTQLSGADNTQLSGKDVTSLGGRDTTKDSDSDVTENTVSAYNEMTYQPKNKSQVTYGKKSDVDYGRTDTTDYGRKDTITYGKKDTTTYGKKDTITYGKTSTDVDHNENHDTDEFHEHVHGNIGVTTTQQMIEQELAIRRKNVYDFIAESFASKFTLSVW